MLFPVVPPGTTGATEVACKVCAAGKFGQLGKGDCVDGCKASTCGGTCAAGRYGEGTVVRLAETKSCDFSCAVGRYGTTGMTTETCTAACDIGFYGEGALGDPDDTASCTASCSKGMFCDGTGTTAVFRAGKSGLWAKGTLCKPGKNAKRETPLVVYTYTVRAG